MILDDDHDVVGNRGDFRRLYRAFGFCSAFGVALAPHALHGRRCIITSMSVMITHYLVGYFIQQKKLCKMSLIIVSVQQISLETSLLVIESPVLFFSGNLNFLWKASGCAGMGNRSIEPTLQRDSRWAFFYLLVIDFLLLIFFKMIVTQNLESYWKRKLSFLNQIHPVGNMAKWPWHKKIVPTVKDYQFVRQWTWFWCFVFSHLVILLLLLIDQWKRQFVYLEFINC